MFSSASIFESAEKAGRIHVGKSGPEEQSEPYNPGINREGWEDIGKRIPVASLRVLNIH
jgi:hypothetical protein